MKPSYPFLFLFLCFPFGGMAQRGFDFEKIFQDYSDHNAVFLKEEILFVFDVVSDTLSVKQHVSRDLMMLGNRSAAFAQESIFLGSFNTLDKVEAYTQVPRNGRRGFDRVDVTHFKESHDIENSIFYNDSRKVQFTFPSLGRGAIASLRYDISYQDPRFIRQWFFQSYVPVLQSKVVVKVHKDVKIDYRIYNNEAADIQFRQHTQGDFHFYEWEVNNMMPYRYAGNRHFSVRHHSPHISVFVTETNIKGESQKFYGDIKDLYRFYMELIDGMEFEATPEMENLVAQLTQGLSEREKIKTIYYWVQQNIRYLAYVDGYKGYVPASPSEVFSKRFGDCKGMAVLLKKMLDVAGLQSHLAWVGTRSIPYTYSQCPLPAVDNHMVAVALCNDSIFVLDATFNYLDFGLNPFSIQGKEVLISLDKQNFDIFSVPVAAASENMVIDSVDIFLTGNELTGQGTRTHIGLNRMELASTLERVHPNDYARRFSSLFSKGNNKFKVTDHEVISLFEYDAPAMVNYQFKLDDYTMASGNELYINLNLDRAYQDMKVDLSGRINPVINDFYFTEKHITRFFIPEGYQLSYLPDNDTIYFEPFRVTFNYSRHEGYVMLEKVVIFEFLELLEDMLPKWNAMVDRLTGNYRISLVFTRSEP